MILEGGLKNLEVYISAHANIKELKDVIKQYTKTDDELLIYESDKNKLQWKIKVQEAVNKYDHLVAIAYNTSDILTWADMK